MTASAKMHPVWEETHWEKAAKTRMGKYLTGVETSFIRNSIDLAPAKTVLDLGAEAGRFSQLPEGSEASVVSLDIDSHGLKRLKQKMSKVFVVQADARCLPFQDETFDAIFMIEVLDYIPELDSLLSECFRTLKIGKSTVLSFGNESSLKAKFREIRGKSYLHSYRRVLSSLQKAGFVVGQKVGYSWLLFGRMSNNLLIPFFAWLECTLGFRRVPRLSPWVMVKATKE